ncbi:MAG: hypothetical protein JO047_13270 [Alphaproteobacteria bacterium]|nr:hypothetical protein [Alphaproteobacteria bacterium]
MRLPQPRRRPRLRPGAWIAAAGLLLVGGIGIGIGLWLPHPGPRVTPPAVVPMAPPSPAPAAPQAVAPAPAPPVAAPQPAFPIRTANEAEILADTPDQITVFRFAPNPYVLVLDFPTLRQQGMMLNRMAAFMEKAGQPHDRLLTDAELDAAIRAAGETVESYYYGHDYKAADLARFFALADRDNVHLTAEEEQLRELLRQEGWLAPEPVGALISIPRTGTEKFMDEAARATILHHELSHGEYFTDADYAAFTRRFWRTVMTEDERKRFRAFLGSQGYDTGLEDLMMNEMQAYLMHTPDPRFFNARAVGIPQDRLDRLRMTFAAEMPHGWLRDETPAPSAARPTPVRAQRRRRRDQSRGRVTRTRASAASCVLRRPAASIAACSARR